MSSGWMFQFSFGKNEKQKKEDDDDDDDDDDDSSESSESSDSSESSKRSESGEKKSESSESSSASSSSCSLSTDEPSSVTSAADEVSVKQDSSPPPVETPATTTKTPAEQTDDIQRRNVTKTMTFTMEAMVGKKEEQKVEKEKVKEKVEIARAKKPIRKVKSAVALTRADQRRPVAEQAPSWARPAAAAEVPAVISRFVRSVERDRSGRFVMAVRHGERMDNIFPDWLRQAFRGDGGAYKVYDMNQPLRLIDGRPAEHYRRDAPLTETGMVHSQMVGRALRLAFGSGAGGHALPNIVLYCSPALRCLQTAANILRSLLMNSGPAEQDQHDRHPVRIRVEPGLFEWLGWFAEERPVWLAPNRVLPFHLVDTNYEPHVSLDELEQWALRTETSGQFYKRQRRLVQAILKSHEQEEKQLFVLLVGHAATIDACLRPLLALETTDSHPPRQEMDQLSQHYPYCCTLTLEESLRKRWRMSKPSPVPPITTLDFTNRFDHIYFFRS